MSKISIEGNASGTGTLTIAAPNTNSNYTLALPEEAGTITTSNSPYSTFRNRIINGDMRIDQRNAGAAVTSVAGANIFCVDRWFGLCTSPVVFTMQQDSSAPTGFVNSTKVTITTIDSSLAASDFNAFRYIIEGSNVADLGWGTANAKTITLSFWVRSSLTGTFTVGIRNSAVNRSYIAEYSISVADTWEYKTITIIGDTTGTWLTTNGIGIRLDFDLGSGSDFQGTAGSWTATNDITTSGSVKLVGTLNATWYITGVQLEVGSVATPFERRPYGQELSLCQRYYEVKAPGGYVGGFVGKCSGGGGGAGSIYVPFLVEKRAAPTINNATVRNSNTAATATVAASSITVFGAHYTTGTVTGSIGDAIHLNTGLAISAEL